jgi:hypothetical protein
MLNNFITGLMRSVGVVMFFAGMAFLAYAVVGGYYHWTIWYYAVAWGFAGWVLFFSGMNLVQQYKATENPVAAPQPPMPAPLPVSPYPAAGTNTSNPWPSKNGGGRQPAARPITRPLDDQPEHY